MDNEKHVRQVPDSLAGLRLDQALARMFPDFSRSRLKLWLQQGAVLVDGGERRPKDRVDGGETVELVVAPEPQVTSRPEAMPIDVLYEDDDIIVVNKAAGLVVHPGAGNPAGTLMNGLLHHAPSLEALPRAGIIHRLDKDTSGVMLIAKSLQAHTALVRALAEREISRHYTAVCNGVLTGGGMIDAPIGRHPVDRTRMSIQPKGRPAVTHYRVAERYRAHTCVDVTLETGRTHQIRVHFAHRRHPLVGDPVYGGRLAVPAGASDELAETLRAFRRQALHATCLHLKHPVSSDEIEFVAEPPEDYRRLLEVLRRDAA